jgi:hypothetical protein
MFTPLMASAAGYAATAYFYNLGRFKFDAEQRQDCIYQIQNMRLVSGLKGITGVTCWGPHFHLDFVISMIFILIINHNMVIINLLVLGWLKRHTFLVSQTLWVNVLECIGSYWIYSFWEVSIILYIYNYIHTNIYIYYVYIYIIIYMCKYIYIFVLCNVHIPWTMWLCIPFQDRWVLFLNGKIQHVFQSG